MAYANWKLGEKKNIKEALPQFEEAQKAVKDKLGAQWETDVDWGVMGELIEAGSSYRSEPGKYIVGSLVSKFVENDLSKMGDDTVAALNGLVGTPAKLLFTMGKKTEKYEMNSRVTITVAKGVVTIKWNVDWVGYEFGDPYLSRFVESKPSVAVKADYPGGWTIAELRSIASFKDDYSAAEEAIKGKLGSDWKLAVVWESFAKNIDPSSSYRQDPGKTVIKELISMFVENDLNKMDDDVTGAANDLVGSKKIVTFRMGAKTAKYKINSRANVSVDSENGINLEWSGDWAGYQWGADMANQFILANA